MDAVNAFNHEVSLNVTLQVWYLAVCPGSNWLPEQLASISLASQHTRVSVNMKWAPVSLMGPAEWKRRPRYLKRAHVSVQCVFVWCGLLCYTWLLNALREEGGEPCSTKYSILQAGGWLVSQLYNVASQLVT